MFCFFVTKIANIITILTALENSIGVMRWLRLNSLFAPCALKLQCLRHTNSLEITEIVNKNLLKPNAFFMS